MLLTSVCPHCIVSLLINQVGVDFRRNWVMRQVMRNVWGISSFRWQTNWIWFSCSHRYMSDVKELVEFCASVHTKACLPDVIIVDNLDIYVHQLKASMLLGGGLGFGGGCRCLFFVISFFVGFIEVFFVCLEFLGGEVVVGFFGGLIVFWFVMVLKKL